MSDSIKGMLPTVTFRPSGAEQFYALMTLMVGTEVEITYTQEWPTKAWNVVTDPRPPYETVILTKRGEITYMNEEVIFLKPYGIPKRYRQGDHYRDIAINFVNVKMIEVVG